MVDVDHGGVRGVDRGAEDRGHIREAVALPVLEQVQAALFAADQQVGPAVAVVVNAVGAQ